MIRLTGSLLALLACLSVVLSLPAGAFAAPMSAGTSHHSASMDCCDHAGMREHDTSMMTAGSKMCDPGQHCADNDCGTMIGCTATMLALPTEQVAASGRTVDRHAGPPLAGLRRSALVYLPEEPPRI